MVADLKGQLTEKVVIDTVVPLNKGRPFVPPAGSALQEAQQILAGEAPVVGALHNISAVDWATWTRRWGMCWFAATMRRQNKK